MPKVIIDGVEYVPKAEVSEITDANLKQALNSLLEIQQYPSSQHKHRAWAWDALNALAPELTKLDPDVAYERINGAEDI